MRNSVFSFLFFLVAELIFLLNVASFSERCTVFLLNAAVFVDLALYLAVCGSTSVESFLLSYHPRASSTSGTVSTAAFPQSFSRSYSLKLATALLSARGRHSLHLATELLSARGRAPTKSELCCESSSGSSVLLMACVL